MNSVKNFFRKYFFSSVCILILFFIINIVFAVGFLFILQDHTIDSDAEIIRIADGIRQDTQGEIYADESVKELLTEKGSWAMILDDDGTVIWEYDMPEEMAKHYTVSDVAKFSRWYLEDYPVTVRELSFGLLVVGYEPNDVFGISMIKLYYVTDEGFIRVVIVGGIMLMVMNVLFIILLFLNNVRKVEKAVVPILQGIDEISHGRQITLPETGELSNINIELNHAGRYMVRKDKARAEWINGISHDVRTPLSIILGYAEKMEEDDALPYQTRKQAEIIRSQAEKMKYLIADLNLTSKLEYSMQPLKIEEIDLIELGRQVVSDFLNEGLDEKYVIEFDMSAVSQNNLSIQGDMVLLKRMLTNLIQNSISHNPNGCNMAVVLRNTPDEFSYIVSDDGVGMSLEKIEQLNQGVVSKADYMDNGETAHGLGLRLVRQIVDAHRGKIIFSLNETGGICVKVSFTLSRERIL